MSRAACNRDASLTLLIILLLTVLSLQTAETGAMSLTEHAEDLFVHHHIDTLTGVRDDFAFLLDSSRIPAASATIRTTTTITDVGAGHGLSEVILAGLATSPASYPDALVLSWEPTGRSLFGPVWSITLRSATGLIHQDIPLSRTTPLAGHRYETLFGYNASGSVSILITDQTAGRIIYQGEHSVSSGQARLFPVSGILRTWSSAQREPVPTDFSHIATIDTLSWAPVYLPVGTTWSVGMISDAGNFLPVRRFRSDEDVVLHIESLEAAADHTFQIFSGTHELLQLDATTPKASVPAGALGWGLQHLNLVYVDEAGTALLTDVQEVTVGSVEAVIRELRVDRPSEQLLGTVEMKTDGPSTEVVLTLDATLTRTEWDPTTRKYTDGDSTLLPILSESTTISAAGTTLQFSIPFPQGDPGLWKVTLTPRIDLDANVPVTIANDAERLFSTHAPATTLSERPFTLVIMPDTQNYPKAYPEILTRQAEWIAANAERLNIGAVLHMGDIVDNNVVPQWERARRSIGALDGVVPYVLAVGNHDVRVLFTPERSLFDREGALINRYFSVENAMAHSNLGGMFQDGRLENTYSLFSFAGEEYLVLSLEWGPRDEVLAWADGVLSEYPSHRAIIITHAFTAPDGGWVTPDRFPVALPPEEDFLPQPSSVNSAAEIWERLIHRHENVFLVLSGHMGMKAIPTNTRTGRMGQKVIEMMVNYQTEPNGGNGWLALLTFTPIGRLEVRAFSPYLCEHRFDFDNNGFWHSSVIDTELGLTLPLSREELASCAY